MSDEKGFSLADSLKAQQALRTAAGLAPEVFPVEAFVGMISDEVQALREQGKSDNDIAALVEEHSGVRITAVEIAEHYVLPEDRQA